MHFLLIYDIIKSKGGVFMKKILCYLLILCMMPLYGICLTADDSINCNFSLSFSPIDEEGIVTVSVHVTDNPGFCALKLLLRYDNTVLRPVPRSDKRNLYQGMLTINANNANANLETMSQYSVVGSGTSTVSKDGVLFSFQMQVLPNAQTETIITCDAPSYVSTIDYASYDIVMEDTAFSLLYPQIIVPAENGEISLSQPYAAFGDEVTVDFAPDRTFMPNGFLLDGTPQEGNTYIAQGVHTVEGNFVPSPKFSLTVDEVNNGQVSLSSTDAYWGEEVMLLAIADEHYEISHFTVDGKPIEGDTLIVTDYHSVSAEFVPIIYPMTIQETEGGSLTLSAEEGIFGTEIALTATPDAHYTFTCFVVDDMLYPEDILTITGAHTICALFTPIRYDISVASSEHGAVSVDTQEGTFGQTVTLSAMPNDHYILEHFTLDGVPMEGNTFSIEGNHTVGASFIPVIYTVTAEEASGGTFSISAKEGIFGSEVMLTATPDMHYRFSHYLLDGEVFDANSFAITKNHTVSAVFTPILYDISIGTMENGNVTADKAQGIFGETITLSHAPNDHFDFEHFLLDGTPLEGNTFSVTGNHTVSASFIPTVYTITAETVVGGTITLSESSGIFSTQITVTATPDAEYNLKHILLDGEVLEGSSFSISKNHTVSALFERKNTVMVTVDIDGKGSVTGAGSFTIGESVTLKATPASKYTFSGWYVGEKKVSTKKEYSFVAEKDIFVEAVFKKSGGGGGGGGNSMPTQPTQPTQPVQPAPVVPVPQTMGLRTTAKEIRFMTATNGQFMPDRAATRYEVIEALDALFFVPETTQSFSLSDVDSAHADIVARFMASGILHGYEDGTFRGENPITRAELCKVLCVLLSLDTATKTTEFTDIASDFWGSPYIAAIANKGYVLGYEDHSFRPNNNITRAELTVLLSRIADTKTNAPHPSLSDIEATHWAYETVLMACKHE